MKVNNTRINKLVPQKQRSHNCRSRRSLCRKNVRDSSCGGGIIESSGLTHQQCITSIIIIKGPIIPFQEKDLSFEIHRSFVSWHHPLNQAAISNTVVCDASEVRNIHRSVQYTVLHYNLVSILSCHT